jgi:hypothetical protein
MSIATKISDALTAKIAVNATAVDAVHEAQATLRKIDEHLGSATSRLSAIEAQLGATNAGILIRFHDLPPRSSRYRL